MNRRHARPNTRSSSEFLFRENSKWGSDRPSRKATGRTNRNGLEGETRSGKRETERREAERRAADRRRDMDSRGRDRRNSGRHRDHDRNQRSRSGRGRSGDQRRMRSRRSSSRPSTTIPSRGRGSVRRQHSRNRRKRSRPTTSSDTREVPKRNNKSEKSLSRGLRKDLMWGSAFVSFSRSDCALAARIFREHGYRAISPIRDMAPMGRELFTSQFKSDRRGGNIVADLRIIFKISTWLETHGKGKDGSAVVSEGIDIDRRVRTWAADLSGIGPTIAPVKSRRISSRPNLRRGGLRGHPTSPTWWRSLWLNRHGSQWTSLTHGAWGSGRLPKRVSTDTRAVRI